jgi:uncharacterized protein YcfJ
MKCPTKFPIRKTVIFSGLGVLASFSSGVQAQEVGRVISSTPSIAQVAVPRQVCSNQPMIVQQPNSGAGAVLGGIAGGAVGNTIGGGSGRAAATVLGVVGGALLGNNVEGSGTQMQNVQQCSTQTFYENRTTGYNVVYEYAGKEFTTQMPYDPGPTIRLQVSPLAQNPSQPPQPAETRPGAVPGTAVGVILGTPNVQPMNAYTTVYPAYQPGYPTYYPGYYPGYSGYAPAYYPRPFFYGPPLGVSLNLGYTYHRHSGGRGWRH